MKHEAAVSALEAGLLVGLPTDTVYGIAADPWSEAGVKALYDLKGRSPGHPIALLAADVGQVSELCIVTAPARLLGERFWPGPLTIVLEAADRVPSWIGDRDRRTVGLRVPQHPVALDLLKTVGALAVTSANPTGRDPALNDRQAAAMFGEAVAAYLPGEGGTGVASTVVDVTVDPPRVLRPGPVVIE